MEEKIDAPLTRRILLFTTLTSSRLFKLNSDALALYHFYTLTAVRQSSALGHPNNTIKATSSYCMKGLGWGKERFFKAKKLLIDNGFVESVVRKDEGGTIEGYYVKLHYFMDDNNEDLEYSDNAEDEVIHKTSVRQSHPVVQPDSGSARQWLNQTVGKPDTNTKELHNINTNEPKGKKNTFNTPADAGTPSISVTLSHNSTQAHRNVSKRVVSTLEDSLLKDDDLSYTEGSKPNVQKNSSELSEGSKPVITQEPLLLTKPIVCKHKKAVGECAKCGRYPCTEEELWEIAEKTNVELSYIQEKHQQILDMIEEGSFSKRYKTVFSTLRNWVRMAKEKGFAPEMEGIARELFINNPPEVQRKKKKLLEEAIKAGIL